MSDEVWSGAGGARRVARREPTAGQGEGLPGTAAIEDRCASDEPGVEVEITREWGENICV